jgi:predicted transcriptional regulator
LSHKYRAIKADKLWRIKPDLYLKLLGLNLVKHKLILDDMEQKGIITRLQQPWGNKKVIIIIKYKGRKILEQYEQMFPMKDSSSCF